MQFGQSRNDAGPQVVFTSGVGLATAPQLKSNDPLRYWQGCAGGAGVCSRLWFYPIAGCSPILGYTQCRGTPKYRGRNRYGKDPDTEVGLKTPEYSLT